MNREIKFRGRAINGDKQWVYGGILPNYRGAVHIIPTFGSFIAVDPATVGQFTGLHDADGREVYEGDVIHFIEDGELFADVVKWVDGGFVLENSTYELFFDIDSKFCYVTGTIHDPKPATR